MPKKVSELAKELNTTSEEVLKTLKSLRMKAKDGKQELSAAAITVVKSALKKGGVAKPEQKKEAVQKKETKIVKNFNRIQTLDPRQNSEQARFSPS